MIVRKTQGAGVSGAVRYITGEGKRDPDTGRIPVLALGQASRVAWVGGTGFGFDIDRPSRVETARRVLEWMAQTQTSKTRKCKDDCLHLMLSWADGEHPPRAEMEAAAHSLLSAIGMQSARAVFAAHADTGHAHMHIVASRIDPQTGKAFKNSYDTAIMSQWALAFEQRSGAVRCEGRQRKSPSASAREGSKPVRVRGQAGRKHPGAALMRQTNIYQPDNKQIYTNQLSDNEERKAYAPPEIRAERDMIAEAARPYREQITQDGAISMNGMPWWLPVAIIFAVYIAVQLWHSYYAQHGGGTPDQHLL